MRRVDPPPSVRRCYGTWTRSVAWSYEGVVTTWRLCSDDGTVRYLKVRAVEETPGLLDEATRLRWARGHLPVPGVVSCGTEGDVDWLVVDALPGRDATAPELKARPEWLVPLLARGLRRFHQTPVEACPFRLTVQDALAAVRQRVANGQAEHADLHPEYRHLSLDDALATLEELAPDREDLVVCHGDYCFPNVLVEGDGVTGYLDLGELAVADRWWDIAVGSWSTTWNIGPGWEERFLDAYGVDPDPRRMTFYRLLYDFIS
ncbi:MAG: aminoglycoside 3'-phosphotransferase [Actinomycetota bacterium]|nr:aminoglycoside 3'-phosphotransferase [Actinomycetota bacterium]